MTDNIFDLSPKGDTPEKPKKNTENENSPSKRPKICEKEASSTIEFSTVNTTKTNNTNLLEEHHSIKRIFPGPAGILSDENQCQINICSQQSFSIFQDGPWKAMSKDYKVNNSLNLCEKFNIAWIKKEANAHRLVKQKAPFLASILYYLELPNGQKQTGLNIILKDATGTIQGTILSSLYESYVNSLNIGSILVLINFGVLSSDNWDNHYLTVTSKNLVAVYNNNENIIIKEVTAENLLKEYYCRKKELEEANNKCQLTRPKCNFSKCFYSSNKSLKESSLALQMPSTTKNSSFTKNCIQSMSFSLPKCKNIIKEANDVIPSPKKIFSFKKMITFSENREKPDANSKENTHLRTNNLSFDTVNNIAQENKDAKYPLNVTAGGNEISVRVENKEHEKIWRDLLEDIDVNSLFDDF